MIRKIWILLLSFIFISCTKLSIEEKYENIIITRESQKLIEYNNSLIYKKNKTNYTGRYIEKYENKQVKRSTYYLEGHKEGREIEFYEDGVIKSEREFKSGRKSGKERVYFSNGNLNRESNYFENLKNESEYIYNDNKSEKIISIYITGSKTGIEKEYKNGLLVRKTPFENSKKNGLEKFYKKNKLIEERNYILGDLLSYEKIEYFDNETNISLFKDEDLINIKTYRNGELVKTTPYINQVENGLGYTFKEKKSFEVLYQNGEIIEEKELLPKPNFIKNIKFIGELPNEQYVFITSNKAILKQNPSKTSERFKEKIYVTQKFKYLGETKEFYKVKCYGQIGYIDKRFSILRKFDFNKMVDKLKGLDEFIKESYNDSDIRIINHYINPTSKRNDLGNRDSYGSRGEQAAIVYYYENNKEKFRYIHDRQYIRVIGEEKNTNKILFKLPGDEKTYKTLKSEVTKSNYRKPIKKGIVLDKKNQNQGIFEKVDDEWNLISYSYINSGVDNGEESYVTPSGEFSIAYTVPHILFLSKLDDGNDTFANYGIRFSGGGYIHTIPYTKQQYTDLEGNLESIIELGEKKLGNFPSTHKCVRNPQSHGQFIYEWIGGKDTLKKRYNAPKGTSVVISF